MAKMVSLKRSASDKRSEEHAGASSPFMMRGNEEDAEGPSLHLEDHHLGKMGVKDGIELPEKHPVELRGHIEKHTITHEDGKTTHHAVLRITHAGTDIPEKEERGTLRHEIGRNHESSERGRVEREEKRVAKRDRGGKQDHETRDGVQ